MVRKALVDNGTFKTLSDLKGRKVASSAPGSGGVVVLNEALKQGGLGPRGSQTHRSSWRTAPAVKAASMRRSAGRSPAGEAR